MAVTYINSAYDFVLDPLKDLLLAEFNYGKIYIAPEMQHNDPFSIRLWCDNIETHEFLSSAWVKQYNVEIFMYQIENNTREGFYKQFYNDIERIYQLLFEEGIKKATTITTGSGSQAGTVTEVWYDGQPGEMLINDFEDEQEVSGLNVCKIIFNCKVMRENT